MAQDVKPNPITRTVHPHEILISLGIFAVLFLGSNFGSYWLGHRGMDRLQYEYNAVRDQLEQVYGQQSEYGMYNHDYSLRINAECHGDASDWATIRMANEVGQKYDLPVFVHGSCQTHQVVDVITKDAGEYHLTLQEASHEATDLGTACRPIENNVWSCWHHDGTPVSRHHPCGPPPCNVPHPEGQ